jgi:hypothetical protein
MTTTTTTITITNPSKYIYEIHLKKGTEMKIILSNPAKLAGPGSTTSVSASNPLYKLTLNAYQVQTLDQLHPQNLSYEETNQLLTTLKSQIIDLEKLGYTFYDFSPKHIYMIRKNPNNPSKTIFIYLNPEHLIPFDPESEKITITTPYDKEKPPISFLSQALLNSTVLPTKVSYKSIYHSLALLCTHYIMKNPNPNHNPNTNNLNSIQHTRLYWKLLELMEPEPEPDPQPQPQPETTILYP